MPGLVLALLVFASPLAAQTPEREPAVIVTTGSAAVRRPPDRASVTVAVETRSASPQDAQRRNAEAMTEVQKRVAEAGIPPDAVRTVGYDLQQEFDFVDGRRVPRDYQARNTLEIRVDDLSKVGALVDRVVQAGATSVTGIQFDLKDRAAAEREALRLAVADARARADAAASGAGLAVDRVLRIEENRQDFSVPRPMPMMARAAGSVETPVQPGLVEIVAQVTLTVSIK